MKRHPASYVRRLASVSAIAVLTLLPACHQGLRLRQPASNAPSARPVLPPAQPVVADPAVVQVGDTLDVMVLEDASFNGKAIVRESGDIILPKIGRVHVAGTTLTGAEKAVRGRIEKDQIKDATVIVERAQRMANASFSDRPKLLLFLTGAVGRPGQHMVALNDRDGVTAYEALLIGGGATAYGDPRRAYILRKIGNGQRTRIPVDLRMISQGQGSDPMLQQGDVLFVPERRFGF